MALSEKKPPLAVRVSTSLSKFGYWQWVSQINSWVVCNYGVVIERELQRKPLVHKDFQGCPHCLMFTYILFSVSHRKKKCQRLLWTVPYSFFQWIRPSLATFFYNFLSLFQWIFGEDWCDGWHSFDVLASTASILNLCVISLDRYWAIEEPMSYPAKVPSINDVASFLQNFGPLPPHLTIFFTPI